MRIVITGSAGRVGRAIVARLAGAHDLVTLDRLAAPGVQHVGDICDPSLLVRVLDGADAVVHVAALHAPHVGSVPDAEFERINVGGTKALIVAARARGVRRIVYTSSTAVYGAAATPEGRAGWVDEALSPQPRTIYHRSKLAAEALLRDAARDGGPEVRILRMSRCFPESAPVMAAYRLHRGVDARDVADAHALALHHTGAAHATWVVSAPPPFEREDSVELWHDAARTLRKRAPELVAAFAARGWPLPARIDRVYDPAAALAELGWRARFGFEEVLAMHDRGSPEVRS